MVDKFKVWTSMSIDIRTHMENQKQVAEGSIAANSTRFGRARSSDEKIVLEPRLKVTVEDSLRHNMRLPFDASVETTKT
jgi:hypothetical protein